MKILLVNVDSPFNLAIRRMYNYFTDKQHQVKMIDLGLNGYPSFKHEIVDGRGYDEVHISNIFDTNKDRVTVKGSPRIYIGGIGSNNPDAKLLPEIEATDPFYYPGEDTSYAFITRGCVWDCTFCKVPKYEGPLRFYNSIVNIVRIMRQHKHKRIKFLDNNILAYKDHAEVFEYLIEHNICCDFNQGLDFWFITEKNAELLSRLNWGEREYIFAFDNASYRGRIEEKMVILKKYFPKAWILKFYIYQSRSMDIAQLIERVEWCRANECLPYIMRDIDCWTSPEKNFYTDYTAYCNQPAFFKKMTFETFLQERHSRSKEPNLARIAESLRIYNTHKEGDN